MCQQTILDIFDRLVNKRDKVRKGLTKRQHPSKTMRGVRAIQADTWRKCTLGRGKSQYKGPRAGACLVYEAQEDGQCD